jgi:hypothetical protein
MLCVASLGRAGGCLLMAAWIHGLLFFPAAFLTLVCSKAYLVSRAALLPSMVERSEDLVPANARLALLSAGSSSVAGLLGAGLFKVFDSAAVLHVDVVLLLVCALLAARLHPVRAVGPRPVMRRTAGSPVSGGPVGFPASGGPGGYPASGAVADPAGNAGVWAVPDPGSSLPLGGLRLVALSMASMRAVAGLMTVLVIFALRRDGAPLYWYGLVGAASVLGNLGGAALAPLVRAHLREERTVPGCAVVIGVVSAVVTQLHALHRWPAALVVAATVTLFAAVAKLSFDSLVQREGAASRRGRVFARLEAMFQAVWVLAALVPALVVLSLLSGFVTIAVVTIAAATLTLGGLRLAERGRLPAWWPGMTGYAGSSPASGRSIRANHSPGAEISAGVGSSCSEAQSLDRPSSPARSRTPETNA